MANSAAAALAGLEQKKEVQHDRDILQGKRADDGGPV